MTRRLLLGLLATTFAGVASAADWPQWRGPNRDGKSADTNLLTSWPAGGPKLLWKNDAAGTGYGSPAIVGDRMYLIGGSTTKKDSKDSLICLSFKDGGPIWSKEFGETPGSYLDQWGGGPRATPTVDGPHIYALGATGDLACFTTDGKEVWKINLVKEYGGAIPKWGYSESVLIDGDTLLCTPGKKTAMVALNKKTGKKIWATEGLGDDTGYASVMIANVGGTKLYVQQSMKQAYGVVAETGKLAWKAGEIGRATAVIPTPVVLGESVFYTAGYGAGCERIDVTKSGNEFNAKVAFKSKVLANHHGGVIEHDGLIFGHSDAGGWTCFDPKAGKEKWQDKGVGKGSISFADGHFYCYSEGKGEVALVKPSADEYKEVGKFSIPELSGTRPRQGKVWPHPVIANGKLVLRDFEKLYVYNISNAAE
jgi:outer membrane protein assembly factor BamB